MGIRLLLAQSRHNKNLNSHFYCFMMIIGYIDYSHVVFIASLMPYFEFSISSVIGTHWLELTGLPWNFDRKPYRWPFNIPKIDLFDNQMNRLYSKGAISIFQLLVLLRIWIISWRIQFLFAIHGFFRLQMSLNLAYSLFDENISIYFCFLSVIINFTRRRSTYKNTRDYPSWWTVKIVSEQKLGEF